MTRGEPDIDAAGVFFWAVVAAIAVAEIGIIVTALRMRTSNPSRALLGTRPVEAVFTLLPASLLVSLAVFSHGVLER